MKDLFEKIKNYPFQIKNVWEVGVFSVENCYIKDFIKRGFDCTLVEAHASNFNKIQDHFSKFNNVKLYNHAIWDHCDGVNFYDRQASSFVEGINSPAKRNNGYKENINESVKINSITFDKIDTGNIDLILVDIEGAEWYVLKYMISRPNLICLETHGGDYKNPFLQEIEDWMRANNYKELERDDTDTLYIKR